MLFLFNAMAADKDQLKSFPLLIDGKIWTYYHVNVLDVPEEDIDHLVNNYRDNLAEQFGEALAMMLKFVTYPFSNQYIYTTLLKPAFIKNFTDPVDKTVFAHRWFVSTSPGEEKAMIALNSLRYNDQKSVNLDFSNNLQPSSLLMFLDEIKETDIVKGKQLIIRKRAGDESIDLIGEVNKSRMDYIKLLETKETSVDFLFTTRQILTNFYQINLSQE